MALAVLIMAATLTLAHQRERLPMQNVLAIGGLILAMAWVAEALLAGAGLPLRVYDWLESGKLMLRVDATIPLLWLIFLLNVRTLARAVLLNVRLQNIGLWVLGCTAVGTAALFWAVAPKPTLEKAAVNGLARVAVALALLICIFPWLVEKKPHSGR